MNVACESLGRCKILECSVERTNISESDDATKKEYTAGTFKFKRPNLFRWDSRNRFGIYQVVSDSDSLFVSLSYPNLYWKYEGISEFKDFASNRKTAYTMTHGIPAAYLMPFGGQDYAKWLVGAFKERPRASLESVDLEGEPSVRIEFEDELRRTAVWFRREPPSVPLKLVTQSSKPNRFLKTKKTTDVIRFRHWKTNHEIDPDAFRFEPFPGAKWVKDADPPDRSPERSPKDFLKQRLPYVRWVDRMLKEHVVGDSKDGKIHLVYLGQAPVAQDAELLRTFEALQAKYTPSELVCYGVLGSETSDSEVDRFKQSHRLALPLYCDVSGGVNFQLRVSEGSAVILVDRQGTVSFVETAPFQDPTSAIALAVKNAVQN
ncbi:MAG: DUF2092 domain-containing protein [Planctomycetota bacterium]